MKAFSFAMICKQAEVTKNVYKCHSFNFEKKKIGLGSNKKIKVDIPEINLETPLGSSMTVFCHERDRIN